MVTKVTTRLVDDIDGKDASETVSFSLDGAVYEIDLSDANATRLRDKLARFTDNARVLNAPTRRRPKHTATRRTTKAVPEPIKLDPVVVREWAKANGHSVASRGRLSDKVVKAFISAN